MSDADTRGLILAYLESHNTLTLATEHAGVPWAAALFYANDDDLALYFLSEPGTRHVQNLSANQRVAVTIQEHSPNWTSIQGVQIEGTCNQTRGPVQAAHALQVYTAKFPFVRDLLGAPRELGAALARARFYKITPTWARLTDNTRGFGWKRAIELAPRPTQDS